MTPKYIHLLINNKNVPIPTTADSLNEYQAIFLRQYYNFFKYSDYNTLNELSEVLTNRKAFQRKATILMTDIISMDLSNLTFMDQLDQAGINPDFVFTESNKATVSTYRLYLHFQNISKALFNDDMVFVHLLPNNQN